jgi:hypothetical protein
VAGTGGDWAAQTADSIDRLITGVRDKTTGPVERIARVVVYGLVAGILGATCLVLLAITAVRVLDVVIPGEVWSADLLVGGIFVFLGALLWRSRTVKTVSTKR